MRAKYKYAQVTDAMIPFINTKQEHDKSLTDFAKQFKQTRDNMKSAVGKDFLKVFIEKTNAYINSSNATFRTELKKKAFSRWKTHMSLRNGDDNKCRILK